MSTDPAPAPANIQPIYLRVVPEAITCAQVDVSRICKWPGALLAHVRPSRSTMLHVHRHGSPNPYGMGRVHVV